MRMPPLEQKKDQEIAAQRCLSRAHCASQERSRRHAPLRRAVLGLQHCLAAVDRLSELDRGGGLVDGVYPHAVDERVAPAAGGTDKPRACIAGEPIAM